MGTGIGGRRRRLFRAPNVLYRHGLGGIVPRRFLYLEHIGRKSGELRNTVLEVVDHDPVAATFHVAAGFGPDSHWYRNLQQDPEVTIQVGRRRMSAHAVLLSADESGLAMTAYAAAHPKAARRIMSVVGVETDGTDASYREVGRTRIPFVRFEIS
jgi:deazaflavin-dependent oxidoreductase (nitroreductase family)